MVKIPKHDEAIVVALADTDETRRMHHRLRYQVYCEELGYEDPCSFSDGEERDRFDEDAVHFVAYDRRSQNWVGALRLIPPSVHDLPLLAATGIAGEMLPLFKERRVAEISRMCVPAQIRRSSDRFLASSGGVGSRCSSDSTLIFFALVRASVDYAFQQKIDYLAFLTSLPLSRLLARLGIKDHPAGTACNHRGIRYPRIAEVAGLFQHLLGAHSDHPFTCKLAPEPFLRHSLFPTVFCPEQALAAYG
ncbi:MAG: PEP-CTERM/exosortase system-associated acyltransferase [Immundisolibacter sp.]|uniref:PEP-CTERM/exosortase system-associated acyltransferase n=1 Tax=Immundisolibacter sp. TaxID=1934948 RepID=UPI003EE37A0E